MSQRLDRDVRVGVRINIDVDVDAELVTSTGRLLPSAELRRPLCSSLSGQRSRRLRVRAELGRLRRARAGGGIRRAAAAAVPRLRRVGEGAR